MRMELRRNIDPNQTVNKESMANVKRSRGFIPSPFSFVKKQINNEVESCNNQSNSFLSGVGVGFHAII